jgi:hypothetical protein
MYRLPNILYNTGPDSPLFFKCNEYYFQELECNFFQNRMHVDIQGIYVYDVLFIIPKSYLLCSVLSKTL